MATSSTFVWEQLQAILETAGRADANQRLVVPTILYNEGWLLRFILAAAADGIDCLPFQCAVGTRWFSEGRLPSRFLATSRGDRLAEGYTHADAVVGDFRIWGDSFSGVELHEATRRFAVLEAKLFSGLSGGVRADSRFDQAARSVACIAELLRRNKQPLGVYEHLGFYVLAPQPQIERGVFAAALTSESFRERVRSRIEAFDPEVRLGHQQWMTEWLEPLLDGALKFGVASWEAILQRIREADPARGAALEEFYSLCLRFNLPSGSKVAQVGT